ncbi:MAG: hypothetical protein KBD37_06800 [Burkholderiales bacterium]|nr:hypothetical protein [Burkholderiales bacterium]
METIKIAFLGLNLDAQITGYNENFAKFFNLNNLGIRDLPIHSILGLEVNDITNDILKLKIGEQQSFILFYNNESISKTENNTLLILYVLVKRQEDHFTVKIVNWLSWVHNIYASIKHGYKALYPLLTHLPQKFSGGIHPSTVFEILRSFIPMRKPNSYSRDYARNVYSSIKNNLKNEYNLTCVDVIDLIKDNKLLEINFNGGICMPNTRLTKNLIFAINQDWLLISVINFIPI